MKFMIFQKYFLECSAVFINSIKCLNVYPESYARNFAKTLTNGIQYVNNELPMTNTPKMCLFCQIIRNLLRNLIQATFRSRA